MTEAFNSISTQLRIDALANKNTTALQGVSEYLDRCVSYTFRCRHQFCLLLCESETNNWTSAQFLEGILASANHTLRGLYFVDILSGVSDKLRSLL